MASDQADAVSCIGLGALGAPMARNLLEAGWRVTVFNRSPEPANALAAAGAQRAMTAAEAAAASPLVLLCLSDDQAVDEVLELAKAGLRPGALVIDCSTISPSTSQRLAQELKSRGVGYVDAPVTGGTEGARAGTLRVLIGADVASLERARPLLEVIGGSLHHFGPVGAGQQAKAVNQVLVAGSYAAVAEALALADRLGLPPEPLVDALKGGAAGSWALENRSQQMINDSYPLGFKLALHRKDLGIALSAAAEAQLGLPICEQVAAIEDALIDQGCGELDVSVLARWFKA